MNTSDAEAPAGGPNPSTPGNESSPPHVTSTKREEKAAEEARSRRGFWQGALDRVVEPVRDFLVRDVDDASENFRVNGKVRRTKHTQVRILFVDSGNASRSVVAQTWAAVYGFYAESAGTFPAMKVRPEAVAAMKEVGLDISSYRPRALNVQRIEAFDRVVVFGDALGKPWTSKANVEVWNTLDPTHLPMAGYRRMRDDLEKRIARLARKNGLKKPEFVELPA